jgi:hypothetical protein
MAYSRAASVVAALILPALSGWGCCAAESSRRGWIRNRPGRSEPGGTVGAVHVVHGGPNAGELAAFYAEITGGEVAVPGDSWAMMTCPDGSAICFQGAPGYSPPTWPDAASSLQMHLDFDVDDLDATEVRVLAAGASKYDFQPNDHCRVYADPAGHPFCLSTFQVLQEQA